MEAIGEYLRNVRQSKGGKGFWSLRAVAKRAGISDSYLSQLETGQVKQPLPQALRKIAEALRHPYEDIFSAAGYLPSTREKSKILEIPIISECPTDKFNFTLKEIRETIQISWDFVKDTSTFGLRIKGWQFKESGISDNDILIVSPKAHSENGDIIFVRIGERWTLKKFYRAKVKYGKPPQIILPPFVAGEEPLLINIGEKNFEIVGKVIRILKIL